MRPSLILTRGCRSASAGLGLARRGGRGCFPGGAVSPIGRGVARQYGVQKVDLAEALALLAELEPLRSTRLVLELRHRFDCSERAAKDAISILRRGDWIEHGHRPPAGAGEHGSQQEAQPRPADGKRYGVNERGHSLLAHPNGPRLLRIARKLFTTCPFPQGTPVPAGDRGRGRTRAGAPPLRAQPTQRRSQPATSHPGRCSSLEHPCRHPRGHPALSRVGPASRRCRG